MEITIQVDDVEGLNEYITDAVNEIVVDEVEKQMHSEFINNDEFQKSVKSAVIHHLDNDIKNHILSDTTFMNWMRTEVWKQVSEKSRSDSSTHTNRELATDDTPNFEAGIDAIHKLSGKDGKLVVEMVNYLKEYDINTLRSILGDITYYFEYCKAALINSEDASRIREHFRVQAKQALDSETDETSN